MVTSGSQQAFDLLARILVTPKRTVVAIEDPGYPALHAALAAVGAIVVPVPVDEEGLVVDKLPSAAQVVCVTPSHQFPSGNRDVHATEGESPRLRARAKRRDHRRRL